MLLPIIVYPCTVNTTSQNLHETVEVEQPTLELGEQAGHFHHSSNVHEEESDHIGFPSNNSYLETNYFSDRTDHHHAEQSGQDTVNRSNNMVTVVAVYSLLSDSLPDSN